MLGRPLFAAYQKLRLSRSPFRNKVSVAQLYRTRKPSLVLLEGTLKTKLVSADRLLVLTPPKEQQPYFVAEQWSPISERPAESVGVRTLNNIFVCNMNHFQKFIYSNRDRQWLRRCGVNLSKVNISL